MDAGACTLLFPNKSITEKPQLDKHSLEVLEPDQLGPDETKVKVEVSRPERPTTSLGMNHANSTPSQAPGVAGCHMEPTVFFSRNSFL